MTTSQELISDLRDCRERLLWLVDDLHDDQLVVPRIDIVNPPVWEIGHVAYFQEFWTLRRLAGRPSILESSDRWYDSARVAHDPRWDLDLPSRSETLRYMRDVLECVVERLRARVPDENDDYFHRLAMLHEDMHAEAFVYTRQTLGYAPPRIEPPYDSSAHSHGFGPCPGDVEVPGGVFHLGAAFPDVESHGADPRNAGPGGAFVFDNEKWAHPRHLAAFRIARAAVTQGEFAEFVDAGGYRCDSCWSDAGRRWRDTVGAGHPVHWRRDGHGRWLRVHFDRAVPLEEHRPVLHVSWYEAEAFCAFHGRRLPTELEWEAAAAGERDARGELSTRKRRYPWGDEAPTADRAHLAHTSRGAPDRTCDVGAFALGDSAFGCRQMIGNVWEWTASDFRPYPGFVRDPYAEYSEPWFGTHKVLRGGTFTTRPRLVHNTWRNFYTPDRRDVLAGFRTCALR